MISALASLPPVQVRAALSDLIIEAELDDGDLRDFIDFLQEMLPEEEDDDECDCDECDCFYDTDCEVQFPCRITCSDDDEDPIDIELSLEALNVILDKTNADGCSFNDAFCAILQEGLNLLKEELGDDEEDEDESEDSTEGNEFGF